MIDYKKIKYKRGIKMRETQVLLIPKNSEYKSRNMTFSGAMEFLKVSKEELNGYIESGDEIRGWYVDEALIYDNKIS